MGEFLLFHGLRQMSDNRTYQKGNPNIPLLETTARRPVVSDGDGFELPSVSSSYQKGDAFLHPKSFVVIFSGGAKTELRYFKPIRNPNRFPNIKIDFFVEDSFNKKGNGLVFCPRIFEYAYDKVKEYKESVSPEFPDAYYIVSDVDHFGESLRVNQRKCIQHGIQLIVSNPCFEVWLYYSKHNDRFEHFVVPCKGLSKAIKKFVHESVKGGLNTSHAIFDIEQNILNAESVCQFDENGLPLCYSTTMFRLAKQILPYIKKDLMHLNHRKNRAL